MTAVCHYQLRQGDLKHYFMKLDFDFELVLTKDEYIEYLRRKRGGTLRDKMLGKKVGDIATTPQTNITSLMIP